jgi:hypothetical protein
MASCERDAPAAGVRDELLFGQFHLEAAGAP